MSPSDSVLTASPLFRGLNDEQRQAVLRKMEAERFTPGEEILTEGHQNQFLWVILSGECEVIKQGVGDDQHQLAILETGGVFGEVSFFSAEPHSASVRSRTSVEALMLWKSKFDELAELHPDAAMLIAANIATVLGERLRKMDGWFCSRIEKTEEGAAILDEWQAFRTKLFTDWEG